VKKSWAKDYMKSKSNLRRHLALAFFLAILLAWISPDALAQNSVNVRIMAANLNGDTQSYQPFALRILQGTEADIVCIQEFNYSNNAASDFRSLVDTCFGTSFVYYREPYTSSGDIPNGIISRWPIINSGSWTDTQMTSPNRGFAWAQIQLPGTNFLYVVSVHLLTTGSIARSAEAASLTALIQSNFPANAWIVVAGDFNTASRTESTTMTTFDSYLSDNPIPADNNGNSFTSENRDYPHDYVLPSFSFTNFETATVFPSHTFPNGLVFDSTVYTPLSDVAPVLFGDSTNAQHMAVMKDFLIPLSATIAPSIRSQPQSQNVSPGGNVTFSVSAGGTTPLAYQWFFDGTAISGATTNSFTLNNAQFSDAGNYSVVITNLYGSITSSVAILTVTNFPPAITAQPQSQTVYAGANPTFTVSVGGSAPLGYQWFFGGTNIPGASTNFYTRNNVQASDAGNYFVVITNVAGSVTSSVATLTVMPITTNQMVIAQWNFNSITPDANTSTGTTVPSIGNGTAALVGGTTATFASGDTNLDANVSDNSAWNTSTYPASGNNKTAGVQFSVSTAGSQNIVIFWSQRSSNTGGKYFRLQYSTNNGANFADFSAAETLPAATVFYTFTNDLSALPGVNNNSNFVFRIVGEFQSTATGSGSAAYDAANTGSTYATSGTSRFDMVTVSGIAIVTNSPPAAATLTLPQFSSGQFQMLVTGSAGANYAVQVCTNLAAPVWISLLTNASPFSFMDTNLTAQQKFYRAISTQ
jgi:endonuclease/exonuclease/phosphatase family metal-dependent hydrolase